MLLALLVVLASQRDVFFFATVAPTLWTSLFLFLLAISVAIQLWSRRWVYLQQLLDRGE